MIFIILSKYPMPNQFSSGCLSVYSDTVDAPVPQGIQRLSPCNDFRTTLKTRLVLTIGCTTHLGRPFVKKDLF